MKSSIDRDIYFRFATETRGVPLDRRARLAISVRAIGGLMAMPFVNMTDKLQFVVRYTCSTRYDTEPANRPTVLPPAAPVRVTPVMSDYDQVCVTFDGQDGYEMDAR